MSRGRTRSARGQAAAPSQRQLRVGEALRHELAGLLNRGDLHDPELAGRSITVTEVRTSPDLRNATAFVMPLGGSDAGAIVAALNRAAPHLQGQLGRQLRLKFSPQLRFAMDDTFEHVARMERLLSALPEHEKADGADDDDDGGKSR
ncbi:30S ribosome-binding factor RbfA [Marinibaculum pumilum]|uniref:Ribosome-binding factor A n=1 Tax=Marinibaculum pumilum TaxID=1766165 RepID=A0ABV7L8H9_9PROT